MAKTTLYHDVLARLALPVQTLDADTTVNGTTVDKADPSGGYDGFTSAVAVIVAGTVTDGTHTFVIQESDNGSTGWAAAAAADIQGGPVALTSADSDTIAELGYTGNKRYIRLSVTSASTTVGGVFGGVIVLGGETSRPVKR